MTEQEFEYTARRIRPQLIEIAYSFFANEAQAEDAVQESLIRLWLLRDRIGNTSQDAEALLVRLTKNICVSMWRRQQLEKTLVSGSILAPNTQPMADDDNTRMLQIAISHLPPSEQRLFRMRQELDMDIQQIAAITGIHPRSVSAIISSARKKIIEQLKKGGIL